MAMRASAGRRPSAAVSVQALSVPAAVQPTDVGLVAVNVATATAVTITATTSGPGVIATLTTATTQANQRYALFSIVGAHPGDTIQITLGSAFTLTMLVTWWPSTGSVNVLGAATARASSSTVSTAPSVTTTAAGEDVVRIFFDGGGNNLAAPTFTGVDNADAGGVDGTTFGSSGAASISVHAWNKTAIGATAATTATYLTASTSGVGMQVAIAQPPPTVVAVADVTNSPPRVALQLSGAIGASTVTINRVDAAGNRAPVRTANPGTVSGGSWVGFDYEAPFNQPVTYSATTDLGNTLTSATVTVAIAEPWLLHPGIPDRSQPIIVATRGDRARDVNQGVHSILGRATPIVISDGARRSQTFDLTLRTENLVDEQALDDLLSDTSTLLLQIVYPGVERTSYEWVSIGAVTQVDVVDWFGNQVVAWTLPCTVTSPPAGLLQAQWSWADVVAGYATWTTVLNAYPTWADVVLNNPSV